MQSKYGSLYRRDNVVLSGTHTHSGPAGFFQYTVFVIASEGFSNRTFEYMVTGIVKVGTEGTGVVCCNTERVLLGSRAAHLCSYLALVPDSHVASGLPGTDRWREDSSLQEASCHSLSKGMVITFVMQRAPCGLFSVLSHTERSPSRNLSNYE